MAEIDAMPAGFCDPPPFSVEAQGHRIAFQPAGPERMETLLGLIDGARERLKLTKVEASEWRFDLIGIDALHGAQRSQGGAPYEVRVRVAGRTDTMAEAVRIGDEVETLYTNGPAGGGGAFKSARDIVAVASVLLPRDLAAPQVRFVEA